MSELTTYQEDYQREWESNGFHYSRWDGWNTPHNWIFATFGPNGKAVTISIPCVDLISYDGATQAKEDIAELLMSRAYRFVQ